MSLFAKEYSVSLFEICEETEEKGEFTEFSVILNPCDINTQKCNDSIQIGE